jgi:hypothetical protein
MVFIFHLVVGYERILAVSLPQYLRISWSVCNGPRLWLEPASASFRNEADKVCLGARLGASLDELVAVPRIALDEASPVASYHSRLQSTISKPKSGGVALDLLRAALSIVSQQTLVLSTTLTHA